MKNKWIAGVVAGIGVSLSLLGAAQAEGTETTRVSWELQLPGVSHHFSAPQKAGKSWNQFHDGLGLQTTRVTGDRVVRYTAGFMRDSFGKQGLYVGGAYGMRLLDESGYYVDLSAAPMLLYRTIKFDTNDRVLIPIVLPMLSFEHKASGIGANITVLPGGNMGKNLRFPGLIYLQFSYRL